MSSSTGRPPIISDGLPNNMTTTTTTTIHNPTIPPVLTIHKVSPSHVDGGGATITALDVRRQKEQELRNNDAYWSMRLAKQEKELQKTNSILEKEYDTAVSVLKFAFQQTFLKHFSFSLKVFEAVFKMLHPNINCHRAKNSKNVLSIVIRNIQIKH